MAENEEKGIGYGRPPEHTRFKKGISGNPAGRRRKVECGRIDVAAILETPLPVKQGGNTRNMGAFEIMMRQLSRRAIKENDLSSAWEFLKFCMKYKILQPSLAPPGANPVQSIPKDWDRDEWLEMFHRYGVPPWPGPRNGLCNE